MEYYIATPTDTPRHTLRWGTVYKPERCPWHPLSVLQDNYPDYRDLLHLQLPGDGSYFVAFYPRRRKEQMPVFSSLAGGAIIQVRSGCRTDFGFLSETERTAAQGEIAFRGTAASLQFRSGEAVYNLGAAGEIRNGSCRFAADGPASLRLFPGKAEMQLPHGHPGTRLQLSLPKGEWCLETVPTVHDIASITPDGEYTLRIPAALTKLYWRIK